MRAPGQQSGTLTWPGPIAIRVPVAAALGWLVVEWAVRPDGPAWRGAAAAGAMAVAAVAAPAADTWAPRGLWTGLALATTAGVYLGVPETGQLIPVAICLSLLWLADLSGRLRVDGLVVLGLDLVLVWAAAWGAATRPGGLVGGLALLGLLVVLPVAHVLPGPDRPLVATRWQPMALVVLQLGFAGAVSRLGALQESALEAGVVATVGLVLLAALARLVLGRRP